MIHSGGVLLSQIFFLCRLNFRRFNTLFMMLTDETDQPNEGEKNQSRRHEQIPREARPRVFLLRGIGFDLLQRQRRVRAAAMERVATSSYSAVPSFSE